MPTIRLQDFDVPDEVRTELAARLVEVVESVLETPSARKPNVLFGDEEGAEEPGVGAAGASYNRLRDIYWGFAAARCMTAAYELDFFTEIDRGNDTFETLAVATECSVRGTKRLLEGLAAIGLVQKDEEGHFRCAEDARRIFSRESDHYSPGIQHTERMWSAWYLLPEAVRKGAPAIDISDERLAGEYFPDVASRLYKRHRPWAELVAKRLLAEDGDRPLRIVDLGAGSAVWSISFAERNPRTRVKAVDFPTVIPLAWEFANRADVEDQYEFVAQSFHEVRYGEANTDLFILGHICHTEGRERTMQLLRKIVPALTREGKVLIADVFANEDRTGPTYEILFGLNWLVLSEAGDIFTVAEFTEMLNEVGLNRVDTIPVPGSWPLIVASRE